MGFVSKILKISLIKFTFLWDYRNSGSIYLYMAKDGYLKFQHLVVNFRSLTKIRSLWNSYGFSFLVVIPPILPLPFQAFSIYSFFIYKHKNYENCEKRVKIMKKGIEVSETNFLCFYVRLPSSRSASEILLFEHYLMFYF